MLVKGNLIYKLTGNKIRRITKYEAKKHFSDIYVPTGNNDFGGNDSFFVSFTHTKKEGLCVNVFSERYSIGMTYEEFMTIYEKLKNPKKIIDELVAEKV